MKPVVQKSSLNVGTHKKNLDVLQVKNLSAFCIIAQNVLEEPYQHLGGVLINKTVKERCVAIQAVVKLKLKCLPMCMFLRNKKSKGKGRWQLLGSRRYYSLEPNVCLEWVGGVKQ